MDTLQRYLDGLADESRAAARLDAAIAESLAKRGRRILGIPPWQLVAIIVAAELAILAMLQLQLFAFD